MIRFIRLASAALIVALTFQLLADSRKVLKIAITASGQLVLSRGATSRPASECDESMERHRRQ